MSAHLEVSRRSSLPDSATWRIGLLVSIATGFFQYLNSWIRLGLIPGDAEYHVHQMHLQQAVQVTLLNSLLTAILLSALWILGMRLRNSQFGEILHTFVLTLLALAIIRSVLLVIPGTAQVAVEVGNFRIYALGCAIALLAKRLIKVAPSAMRRAIGIASPVSVVSLAMLGTLVLPVIYALGRGSAPIEAGTSTREAVSSVSKVSSRSTNTPSIVWVILDEFDASIAWKNRPNSVKLPEIDRFRYEAVNFQNATAPSSYTVTAIPSLLTGIPYDRVVRKETSDIILAVSGDRKEYSFRDTPNTIDWANEVGVPVTLVGWTHPYCRIFGDKLAQCAWYENPHMSSSQSWAVALSELSFPRAAMAQMWQEGKGISADPCEGSGIGNLTMVGFEDYRAMLHRIVDQQRKKVRGFLRSGVRGLRILHLATPHPPGFPSGRERASVADDAPGATFAANYATADAFFGEIRSVLEQRGEWDSSLVILTSDHGLRGFWELTGCLGEEDLGMLRHRDEKSVPLMVKWPGGSAPATVEEPVSTLMLAPMVRAYLRGEMTTPGEFASWVQQQVHTPAVARLAEGRHYR